MKATKESLTTLVFISPFFSFLKPFRNLTTFYFGFLGGLFHCVLFLGESRFLPDLKKRFCYPGDLIDSTLIFNGK